MAIRFNYVDRKLVRISKTHLKQMVLSIFKDENRAIKTVNYIFCSDDYLLKINQQALNHDYYTDIITFPLSESDKPIEAEIYVSIDRVKENAAQLNQSFKSEIARVLAHGALHLCGYNDKKKKDIIIMRKKEVFYIAKL
ncbi:MAG: rRNA maturation RNase YbeY [Chitinophagaceae bacterium]